MASVAQASANGDGKPSSPVDLSTIPISPDGNKDENKKPDRETTGDEQITVFHDKDNFNVKHPLAHNWTLWFTKPPSGKASFSNLLLGLRALTFCAGRQLERVTEGGHHFQLG
jgi:translation initiation factor 4E